MLLDRCHLSVTHSQSSGRKYPGVPPNRLPKAWASSTDMPHAVHEPGVILMVTSSKDANTGPTWGSVIAAALIYRLSSAVYEPVYVFGPFA